ncbi:MAG: biopolymer transporter ExbD [Deltaproteobacteria bacterium]|nr:MAG: biopolymer transporter ExbD [Deltaproteobacteria bacterium]
MEFDRTRPVTGRVGMTPMIDVVFLLLIFFLLTSRFVEPRAIGVELPRSKTAAAEESAPLVVVLRRDGSVLVDGSEVARSRLEQRIARELGAAADRSVRLEADAGVSVQRLVGVLDDLRAAGATRVALAAQQAARSDPPER